MLERLRTLRKTLGFTQAEFGKKLSMAQTGWGMIENGNRGISDRTIAAICAIFGVNEEWLRNGTGEMFVVTKESIIDELVDANHLSELDRKIIDAYIDLTEESRAAVAAYLKQLAAKFADTPEAGKTQILKIANSKDNQVKPKIETVDENEVDALFDLPDTDQK